MPNQTETGKENVVLGRVTDKLGRPLADLIVRAYETTGRPTRATIRLPHWTRTIDAHFQAAEIKTFRIPSDPSLPVVETNMLEWSSDSD